MSLEERGDGVCVLIAGRSLLHSSAPVWRPGTVLHLCLPALRRNSSSSSSFTLSCWQGLPLTTPKVLRLVSCATRIQNGPLLLKFRSQCWSCFYFYVLNKTGWRTAVPRSPAMAKQEPGPGHLGSGKESHAPTRSMTCVSDCKVVLAPDQEAKGAELLSSVSS